ncbi:MAG: cell surface protein SprA, partial [Ginsengibacter sp.]
MLKRIFASASFGFKIICCIQFVLFIAVVSHAEIPVFEFDHYLQDTIPQVVNTDSLKFPINDRHSDFLSTSPSTFDLGKPSNIKDSVVYDPVTKQYVVYEKIGDRFYRTPTTYTSQEFIEMQGRKEESEYFKKRANTLSVLNRGLIKPKLNVYDKLFNRLFGNGKIEIEPQGNVDITAGYQGQNIKNPTLPERARKNGGFDFDMAAQLSVNANIGDKLKFPIAYNTLANFDFSNQLKLDYSGLDDEILKRFEAGNISFPSKSTLIPGAQSLFGIKTELQFGKLYVTTVLANQKSQRQSVNLQGGAAAQTFEIKGDDYEENRHFLLGQYFHDNYNKAMQNLPAVTTPVQILRLEVWVTNKNGTTTEARDIVGLMDLGEQQPFFPGFTVTGTLPSNNTNTEYSTILANSNARNPALITNQLLSIGLKPVQDFEKTYARKLDSTQFVYNSKIGFVSINQPLQPDEVLGVAYQYTYNGRVYQVGEFSQDIPPDTTSGVQKVLFLKLLKATSQRTNLPIWDLMMKNVYSVGYGSLERQDFKLDVLYQEPGLGAKRYVPFGDINQGTPILTLVNLDRLNNQNDPQPDGVFDYVEYFTVIPQYSRVIFPVLEPFGRDLAERIYAGGPPATARDTLYYALYDSIKAVAQQFPNLDRFILRGSAKTSSSTDISIGYNIPQGSVNVTAGGQQLRENIDYTVNYDLGTIKIINQAIINAGLPVQVNFENNASFGLQQRNYMALRLDYLAKNTAKEQMSIGGTIVRLGERPYFTKVDYGEDPIRNTMYGLDLSYRRDAPRITKILDKLPFYQATAPSNITAYVEGAYLQPGHAPQIGKGNKGLVYIDDFEGSKSDIDLRFPPISWALASTPLGATDRNGIPLFPEASSSNSLDYGKNRAKLAWYQIEPILQDPRNINNPVKDREGLSDPRVRAISQTEIFPQRSNDFGQNQLITFDLAYYPTEKGPYNFDASTTGVQSNGKLLNPKSRWGGLMRNIDQTDFETGNVEYIECWIQDPFINTPQRPNASQSSGGKFYINLGNVSEDLLKDSRRFFENGLPTPNAPTQVDNSVWGRVPRNPAQITNAFSNDPADRPLQDVGFDGLNDAAEAAKRATDYLDVLRANFGINSPVYQNAIADPSSDNYHYYRGDDYDAQGLGLLGRYKKFNNPEGNSPVASTSSEFSSAATLYPDQEDLNRDNTLNETEEYFQYIVDLKPSATPEMQIGQNYIVDKKDVAVNLVNGTTRTETWYQLRIPINSFSNKVGNIPDFKSIRFIRLFLTDFEDSVVVRFGKLDLVRNVWRKFKYNIDSTGIYAPDNAFSDLNVGAVNIEENDKRQPLPYRTPTEIERVQTLSSNGVNLLQNEQALSLKFCNLQQAKAKGVFQTFANRDIRQFRKLQMYIHAEKVVDASLNDDDLTAVVRIGNDFVSNYYEVRIPLKLTPLAAASITNKNQYSDTLWIAGNSLDLDLDILTKIKIQRNVSSSPLNAVYRQLQPNGQTYSILGNPNLGEVKGILLGVENTRQISACGEVWFNELRLSSLNEKGGWAALGRVDMTLSDLGTLSLSANTHTNGFGTLEQRVTERYRDDFTQFDAAANLELGKILPKQAGLSVPLYAGYSQTVSAPEFNPYDLDIKLKDKLGYSERTDRDSIRKNAIDFTSIKTFNLTNVRKNKTNNKKAKITDISNIDVSYNYTKTQIHNPLIENNEVTKYHAGLGYNYAPEPKYIEPFKKFVKTKS